MLALGSGLGPAAMPSRSAARPAGWALVVTVSALFAVQLGVDERAAQARDRGAPSFEEVRELRRFAPTLSLSPELSPRDAGPPRDLTLALPQEWVERLPDAGKPLVFLDGEAIAFRRRRPLDEAETQAYYQKGGTGPASLAIRCGPSPCRQVLAVLPTPTFDAALLAWRLHERPAALLGKLGLLIAFVVVTVGGVGRWRVELVPPALLGPAACGLWLGLGLAGTPFSMPLLGVELASAGAPLVSNGISRLGAVVSRHANRLVGGRRAVAVGLGLMICGAAAARVFHTYLLGPRRSNDHWLHLENVQRFVADGVLPPQFLFHLSVALLAGFSTDLSRLAIAAQLLLTCAVLAKLLLSSALARDLLGSAGTVLRPGALLLLLIACFFAGPLPNWWKFPHLYQGQIVPVVWHNPTTILLMPFAVAVFWIYLRADSPSPTSAIAGSLLLCVSVLVKPQFALAFVPALGLLFLAGRLSLKTLVVYLGPTAAALAWQTLHYQERQQLVSAAATVTIEPLAVWRLFSENPLASLALSLAFPIAVCAWTPGLRLRRALSVAWLILLAAILEFALLAEPGPTRAHGNFYWGSVPATHLLFVVSICELLARGRAATLPSRLHRSLCWTLLGLHVAAGVFFYWRSLKGLGFRA